MNLNGRGCPRDVPAGLRWLKQATESGSVYATGLLALHYFTSKLFSKSTETSMRSVRIYYIIYQEHQLHLVWTCACRVSELACEAKSLSSLERQGVALACFTLARCLQLGRAVEKDRDKALEYFTKVKCIF